MKQLILLLAVAALISHSQAQGNKSCAKNGEYCLLHAECCSGSCLSFSYKCVPTPPGAQIGTTFIPTTVDTANRFGNDGGASITQKTCARNGEYCLIHAECCSGNCLTSSYQCIPGTSTSQGASALPSGNTGTTVDLGNRVGENQEQSTQSMAATEPTTPKKCAAVGEYCLTAAECCSKSCLSFSYKCVNNYDLGTQLTSSGIPVRLPVAPSAGNNAIDNRFGGGSGQCKANGYRCYGHGECCSGTCYKLNCVTQIQLGIPESELTRPSAVNGPYVPVNSLDDLINRFGGGSPTVGDSTASGSSHQHNAVIGSRSTAARQCLVVGNTCGRHEDCCSLKCLTYIRKCVT